MERTRTLLSSGAMLLCAAQLQAQDLILPAGDRILRAQPARVFVIGQAEGQSWEMLDGVRGLAFDTANNLYVLEFRNPRVLVFDARGKFVRQFGKKGRGPGELQVASDIVVNSNREIVVNDAAQRQFVVYSPTGTFLRNVSWNEYRGGLSGGVYADPRGAVIALTSRAQQPDSSWAVSLVRKVLHTDSALTVLQQIPAVPLRTFRVKATGNMPAMTVSRAPEFAVSPNVAVLPDGTIAVYYENAYRVRLFRASGATLLRTFTRAFSVHRVTQQHRDAWQRRQDATAIARGSRPTQLPYEMPFAETMSVITDIMADPQSRIWIQRRQPDGAEEGPIDLLTAGGRYIGTLPAQSLPQAVSVTGRAAYVERDRMGVERVVVRQLPSSWK